MSFIRHIVMGILGLLPLASLEARTSLHPDLYSVERVTDQGFEQLEFTAHKRMLLITEPVNTPVPFTPSDSFRVALDPVNAHEPEFVGEALPVTTRASGYDQGSIQRGDFDGDGFTDLLVVSGNWQSVFIVMGSEANIPGRVVYFSDEDISRFQSGYTLASVNGDGVTDIYFTSSGVDKTVYNLAFTSNDAYAVELDRIGVFYDDSYLALKETSLVGHSGLFYAVNELTGDLQLSQSIRLPVERGVMPKLNVSYSSAFSVAGREWSVGPASQISVCYQKDGTDNYGELKENLCLDGELLKKDSDSGKYLLVDPMPGNYVAITDLGNGKYRLDNGAGITKIYGSSSSRFGKVSYISSVTGIYGEKIDYSYSNGLLENITYGAFEVDIQYTEVDSSLFHIDGYSEVSSSLGTLNSGRLYRIEVKKNDQVISRKNFFYEEEREGRLISMQQCYYSPEEECESPYYFEYYDGFIDRTEYSLGMSLNEFKAADFTSFTSERVLGGAKVHPVAILGRVTQPEGDQGGFSGYKVKKYDFGRSSYSTSPEYTSSGNAFISSYSSDGINFSLGLTSDRGHGDTGDSGFLVEGYRTTSGQTCTFSSRGSTCTSVSVSGTKSRLVESYRSDDIDNFDFVNSRDILTPEPGVKSIVATRFHRHDVNRDGVNGFLAAFTSKRDLYNSYHLSIERFGKRTSSPLTVKVGEMDTLSSQGFDPYDISVAGPFDLDYDGTDEVYVGLSLNKGYIIELNQNGYAEFGEVASTNNFGVIMNSNMVYGDFNGDGLLDAVSTSGDSIDLYSGIYRVGSVVKYGRVTRIGSVSGASITVDGASTPNILPIDYDRDGKDELWIAGSFYSIMNNELEHDRKASGVSFSCRSVECVKLVDYDRDSVSDLVEWSNGKVITHNVIAKRKQIERVKYDGETLFKVDYSDVYPKHASGISGVSSFYPTDSISLLRKQKVTSFLINNGSKGWVKKIYEPNEADFGGGYSGYGYKKVHIENYSTTEVSSNAPLIGELVFRDEILGRHFKGNYYTLQTNRSFYEDGIVSSIIEKKQYSYKSVNGDGYQIEKKDKLEVLGPYTTKLAEELYLVDKFGRFKKKETNSTGAKVEIKYLYEYSSWPSFASQATRTYVDAQSPYVDVTKYQPLADKPLLWKTDYHVGNLVLGFQEERQYYPNYDLHKVISSADDSFADAVPDRTLVYSDYDGGLPKTITNQYSGQEISKVFDLFGRVTSESSNGHVVTYDYDSLGRLISENDNTGLSVNYNYAYCTEDCIGGASYVAVSEVSTGAVEKIYLDINGSSVGKHNYNQATGKSTYSKREYDEFGRLAKEYKAVESLDVDLPYSYEYYSNGSLKRTIAPGPVQSDDTRTPIETSYNYVSQSNGSFCGGDSRCIKKTTIQSSASSSVSGEVITTPERRTISYIQEDNGRVVRSDSAGGTTKYYEYDVFGNISLIKESGEQAGDGSIFSKQVVFKRTFDVNGMMVASERPGRGAEYKEYTPFGEILKETYASGDTVSYAYDGAGRISSKVYSGTSDLAKRSYSWLYDTELKGMLDGIRYHSTGDANDWSSIYEYDYDEYGRLEVERNNLSQTPLVKNVDYNSQGLPDSVSMSAIGAPASVMKLVSSYQGGVLSGASVASYNSDSGEEELQPLWSVSEWDFKGRQLSVDYFNSAISLGFVRDQYSSTLLRKNLSHSGLGVLDGEDVYFDTHGDPRLKVGIEDAETTDSLVLSYDNDQRLTSVDDRTGMLSSSYSMDDFGNFNYKDRSGNSYSYDLNESATESSVDSGSITYGKLEDGTYTGHMSNVGGYVLTHNEKGQPSTITSAEGSVTFTYGPYDELVSVDYSSGETLQLWGGMQVSTGSDHGTFYRFRVGDLVLIRGDVEGDFITYTDYLGSERSIWNSAGQLIASATYDAYGKKVLSTNMQGYDFVSERGYTSHLDLKGFPFVHMKNRLYSPDFGLFTSIDPVFDSVYRTGGLNGYGYVSGNPYKYWDPAGMAVALTEEEMISVQIGGHIPLDMLNRMTEEANVDFQEYPQLDFGNMYLANETGVSVQDYTTITDEEVGVALDVGAIYLAPMSGGASLLLSGSSIFHSIDSAVTNNANLSDGSYQMIAFDFATLAADQAFKKLGVGIFKIPEDSGEITLVNMLNNSANFAADRMIMADDWTCCYSNEYGAEK